MSALTKAMAGALARMLASPHIFVRGGFGGNEAMGPAAVRFAKRITIDCLIRDGYAEPADAFNAYRITQKGRERYRSWAKHSAKRGKAVGEARV
jgi:hypothetical protein